MDASQKGKAVADLASLRGRRKSRTSEAALAKKKEIEAAGPRSTGIVIRPRDSPRPSALLKSSAIPLPVPVLKPSSGPSPASAPEPVVVPVVPPSHTEVESGAATGVEDDLVPISQLAPSPERPSLKRLRLSSDPKVRAGSAPSTSPIPPKGKGGKGKNDEDVRDRLEEIPAKARSKVIAAVMAMYKLTDKLALAYLDQMEEVGVASSEREAREEKDEEINTLKAQLDSMGAENTKVVEENSKLKAELAMANGNWRSAEEKASQHSSRCDELELSISSRVSEAELAKEKEMMDTVLPAEIRKALADFKAGEMASEIEKAVKEGIDKFKAEELTGQLQSEFVRGIEAFPYTKEGEKYLQEEWGAGLVEYRDVVLHYHPSLDARELDRHFPDIFPHARIEGEIIPEIVAKDSPTVEVAAEVEAAPPGDISTTSAAEDLP